MRSNTIHKEFLLHQVLDNAFPVLGPGSDKNPSYSEEGKTMTEAGPSALSQLPIQAYVYKRRPD